MFHLRRTSRFAALAGLLAIIGQARAELSSTSPFLPPQNQTAAAPTTPPPLELRGVMTLENVTLFSIFDPSAKRTGAWVKLNEQGPGFTVKKYEPDSDTVTVDYQGRTLRLPMRTPKIASSGPVMAMPPIASPLVMQSPIGAKALASPPAVPNTIPPANATPPGDGKMAEWTAEIQKRRDARNLPPGTATTPAQTPSLPAVAPPVPPGQVRPAQPANSMGNSQTRAGQ